MAWAANELNSNDVVRTLPISSDDSATEEMDLEAFQEYAKEKYDLPEDAATLIFSRKNTQENGEFDTGSLDAEQVIEADENLQAFDKIVEDHDLKGMDKEAAIILTGDIDGKMTSENVDVLIDEGILEIEDGQMKLSEDEGQDFFNYLMDGDESDLIGSKHIVQHLADFKDTGQTGSTDSESDTDTESEEKVTMDPSGKFQTKTVTPAAYNTKDPEVAAFNTKEIEATPYNTKEVKPVSYNTKDVNEETDTKTTTTGSIRATDVDAMQELLESFTNG